MLRTGEVVFPREDHTNSLSNTKWSALRPSHQSGTVTETEQVSHVHIATTNKKEAMDIKEWGNVWEALEGRKGKGIL